ncbi:hypothetical protein [Dendrosporobacter sp. 1207_IL3150]|uniref:hypothetical protein n=1 Tax=Dendrosporobacter sp. 1207_IL3150 TaxID=3084054 RepID=UPI003FA59FAF
MMAIENLQRKDLSIVEEGEVYYHLGTAFPGSQHDLSKLIGINRRRISYAINAYTKLSSEVQQMVQQKQITEESTRKEQRKLILCPNE